MRSKSPIIQLKNVGLSYRRRKGLFRHDKYWALKDVSFSLYQGETLGVIGRNGVGKSSLLRVLAGIVKPDSGTLIRGEQTASLLSLQAGFIPQVSGRMNILLGGMLLGLSKKEVLSKMDEIIAFSGLNEFIDVPFSTYSSGMRARLGFSIAYQCDPDIILIDEVMGVGDKDFRKVSSNVMKDRIHSDRTVVIVSHSIPLLRELCDRVVWIEEGMTKGEGEAALILDQYQAS